MTDALHEIARDPNFGKNLSDAISAQSTFQYDRINVRAGCYGYAATVIESHHADYNVVVAIGGNVGIVLGNTYSRTRNSPEEILKQLAENLGYVIYKKPAKRPV